MGARRLVLLAATGLLLTLPGAAAAPDLLALGKLQDGLWELRFRDHSPSRRLCLHDAWGLIQLQHPDLACDRLILEDRPDAASVHYTCKGKGFGRSVIHRESAQLIQLETQGLAGGLPFELWGEGRRIGDCPAPISAPGMTIPHQASTPPAVVLLSGGLDSMVTAALAHEAGFSVNALTIDYNQRHRIELDAAARIAKAFGVARHIVLPLDLRRFGGSALTDDIAVPKEGVGPGVPVTYVPARNLVFLSLTLAWAEALGARDIFIGVNALDYSGYPDCRPEFIAAFQDLATMATKAGAEGGELRIHAPLQHMGKDDIARETARLGIDPGLSWSCYDPQPGARACGRCDSCRLRRDGFARAGLSDPTPYAV